MNKAVKTIMTKLPHTIGHDISVEKAKQFMHEYHCHHLPVLDGGKLVGIISDRDIQLVEAISDSGDIKVEELMTEEPVVVDPNTPIKAVVEGMLKQHINSVIVSSKEGEPWGIFTSTNALEYLASDVLN